MLEAEIRSTATLKEKGVDFWDHLKARNLEFATRLSSCNSRWAERAEKCCDNLKFKECINGYLVFKSAFFCRVRGCPLCEWRKSRKIAKLIAAAVSRHGVKRSDEWQQLTLCIDPVPVVALEKTLDEFRDGFGRLSQLKAWRFKGGFQFLQFQWIGDEVRISIHFLGLTSLTGGRNYVSKKKWTNLWRQSLRRESTPMAEFQRFGQIPFNYVAQKSKMLSWRSLNLELCPDSCFAEAVDQIHRRKTNIGMGCFRKALNEEICIPRRTNYYPSEEANLWAMRSRYFGYLPNPDKDDHDDQYLVLPEYCWDEELIAELRGE